VLAWLLVPRQEKVGLAVEAVVAVVVVAVLVKLTAALHTDPRPFVIDPHIRPLFPHPRDNGFPSDHTALASGVSLVVLAHRRWVGLVLLLVSVAIGVCRVAAHVHHTQDIVAGLVVGGLAALLAVLSWRAVDFRRRGRVAPDVAPAADRA